MAILAYIYSALFLLRHCDVIRWLIFMILLSMERGDLPYTVVPNNYTLGMSISKSEGGGMTLRKTCYKKKAQEDEG